MAKLGSSTLWAEPLEKQMRKNKIILKRLSLMI